VAPPPPPRRTGVNAALRDVIAEFAYRPDRTPTPADVTRALERHSPDDLHSVIADTIDRTTLHPLRAREGRARSLCTLLDPDVSDNGVDVR